MALLVGVVGIAVYAGTVLAHPAETKAASGIHIQHAVRQEAGTKLSSRRCNGSPPASTTSMGAGRRVRARVGERLGEEDDHRLRRTPHGRGDGLPLLQRGADGRSDHRWLNPEVLVYAPGPTGDVKLVAVEWVVRGPNSEPPGVTEPPSVLGMEMHILVPAVGFYIMHAWVLRPNPAGMFEDWNPEVSCS